MNLEFSQKIQKIKEAVNIVDIIGQYLKLSRKGNNFWAVCPFHEDSNPSLSVSQEKQIYKCFSCNEQGNVFIFLQKYKNIDFFVALKEVADFAKIDLKDFDLDIKEGKKNILHPFKVLNNLAVNFYQYQLTTENGKQGLRYLQDRHITEANINDFGIGYAPSNNQLLDYLHSQGYQDIDIIEAGLAKISEKDKVKDMFFDRIIFPIVDLEGNCLGFSARKYLSIGKETFKYINTPETEIFKKGQILYNLFNAKKAIAVNNDNIYLVEGYMDVISLSKQNINNCVALMGTNLTKDQMFTLKKITNNIIIFLDGDEAGKTAAYKIAIKLLANDFNVKIVDNSTDLDPDELINKDVENFKQVIANTLHPLAFAINFFITKYDIKQDSEQLKAFLTELKPLWQVVKDQVTRKFYLTNLISLTGLSEQELQLVLKLAAEPIIMQEQRLRIKQTRQRNSLSVAEKLLEVEKHLFYLLLLDRDVYLFLEQEKFIFANKNLMNLYFLVSQQYQENDQLPKIDLNQILDLLKDNEIANFLKLIIKQHENKKYEIKKADLQDYLKIIKKHLIELEIESLEQKRVKTNDIKTGIELIKEMSLLKKKLNE